MEEDGVKLSFEAPNRPLSINEANRMHWASKRRRLEPWRELTHYSWVQCRDKKLVKGKRCLFQIHLPFNDERRRDPHNYSSTVQKAVIDSLVDKYEKSPTGEMMRVWEGCWPDDTPEWVKTLEPILYKGTKCVIEISPL